MSVALTHQRPPSRRLWTPRLVATLGLFVLSATFFCAIIGFVLVRQADDRQNIERRAALLGAIEDIRSSGANFTALDPGHIKNMERTAGLKDLRFETEPVGGDREVQSVLNGNGRIIGWFSWLPDRSMSNALGTLKPLMALTGLFLVVFAGIALWQVQRAVGKLGSSEQLAWTLAYEDMLTGLPNHRKMIGLIDQALAGRGHGEVVTLCFLDLDGLKDVNDALGHRMGDDLLKAVAARIKDMLPARAVCGRFDGDEFALLMTGADDGAAEAAVAALAGALARPFWLSDQAVQVGVTAGLGHAPRDAQGRDELMRCADLALRAAKKKQRGGMAHFEPAMEVEFDDRRFLEQELRHALDQRDARCPLPADRVRRRQQHPRRRGAAALDPSGPRRHPADGFRSGRRAMRPDGPSLANSCCAARWSTPRAGRASTSRSTCRRCRCATPASSRPSPACWSSTGLQPSRLMLEVTEGVLIDKPEEAKDRLDALKVLGVRLALDDFGTGYSSLTYLQRFNFDKLKIDRGFVAPLGRDVASHALLQAIVGLGRALDLTLLAEGVETEEQRVLLRLAGCEEMQGYLFAKPAPAAALDRLLAENAPQQAAVA